MRHLTNDILRGEKEKGEEFLEKLIICGDQGQKAVLLSLEEFNSWQATLYLLANPANVAHLRQSITESKAGKTLERELLEP